MAPLAQKRLDLLLRIAHGLGRGHLDHDRAEIVRDGLLGPEQTTPCGGERNERGIVLIGAEARLALGRERADHGEGHILDANLLAERWRAPEQLALRRGAEDHYLGAGAKLRLGEAAPISERPIAHLEIVLVHAGDRGRPVGIADHDRGRAADHSGRAATVGTLARIAARSPSDRASAVPSPARLPPEVKEPGMITSTLVPSALIRASMASPAPLATDTITITEATPMITPSMARKLLSAFTFSAAMATLNEASGFTTTLLDDLAVAEGDPPPRAPGDVGLMGDEDHGDAGLVQLLE